MKDLSKHNATTRKNPSPTDNHVVLCEHPREIVNPKVVSAFFNGHPLAAYDIYGIEHNVDEYLSEFRGTTFNICRKAFRRLLMKSEAIQYFFDLREGEEYDPYILVPCGKCELCLEKKRNHIAIMCQMECQQHNKLPIFLLLTYNDCFRPDIGVRYSDFQDFIKRIRNVYRDMTGLRGKALAKFVAEYKAEHGLGDIRFCACGEYGNDDRYSHRPHWHALLWDFPVDLFNNDYVKMRAYFEIKWKMGICKYKECFNTDAGYYVGKYMAKQEYNYFGNPPVVRHSNNLGVNFVSSVVKSIVKKNPTYHDFKYCDKHDHSKVKMLPLTSYYLHKLFPTFSKVPSYIKDAVRKLNVLTDLDPVFNIMEVDSSLRKKIGYTSRLRDSIAGLPEEQLNQIYADCTQILQHEYEGKYIDYANNEGTISAYLESLFSDLSVDVSSKAYQLKKARAAYNNKIKTQGVL